MAEEARESEADGLERRQAHARRLLLYKALTDWLKELDTKLRREVLDDFITGDRQMSILEVQDGDGWEAIELGSVTRTRPFCAASVADEGEFFAWVLERRPDMIVQTVDPTFRKAVLEEVKGRGAPVDEHGEVIEGIEVTHRPGGLQTRPAGDIRRAIPMLLRDGDALELEPALAETEAREDGMAGRE